MDLILLTETIVKMLCQDKEAVSVKEYETTEEDFMQIDIVVAEEDLGRVIGKNGKTIQSIRNIVRSSAALNNGKKVKIEIDSY